MNNVPSCRSKGGIVLAIAESAAAAVTATTTTLPTKMLQTKIEYLKNKLSCQYVYYNHSEPRKAKKKHKTKQINIAAPAKKKEKRKNQLDRASERVNESEKCMSEREKKVNSIAWKSRKRKYNKN